MSKSTTQEGNVSNRVPVLQAGSSKIHLGRPNGKYASGETRFVKICGTNRNDRYFPSPVDPDTEITCKRCIARGC